MAEKKTWPKMQKMKAEGEKIAMLTAYDYASASMAEKAGVDIILVGDSVGNVVQGQDNTLPVTVDEMIYHTKAVKRGAPNTCIITDMPFGSYEVSIEEGVRNAIRILKETGCDGVKLEGGAERAALIKALTEASVPVMAHIGMTPQKIAQMGNFAVQGKSAEDAQKLLDAAKTLEAAGAVQVLMECVPTPLATMITDALEVPTIGIGAGNGCTGQVLVWYDMAGMYDKFCPKFVKKYAEAGKLITEAMAEYVSEVKSGAFPDEAHSFAMKNAEEILPRLY
ncbi:MAG: 3-methyl-2-oxobutanoate hydroxymethyltransferase [Firmicutes bacterium]|nr:3-methyl-2-oxobutanoate hydroxymethyltransferase [Bacillota bacterium]